MSEMYNVLDVNFNAKGNNENQLFQNPNEISLPESSQNNIYDGANQKLSIPTPFSNEENNHNPNIYISNNNNQNNPNYNNNYNSNLNYNQLNNGNFQNNQNYNNFSNNQLSNNNFPNYQNFNNNLNQNQVANNNPNNNSQMNNQTNTEEDIENKKLKRKYCACCFKKFGRNEEIACIVGRIFGVISFIFTFFIVISGIFTH